MAAIQLNFTLRTSGNVKTVHLVGSWDNYANQLPLSRDASKSGGWKSTFRFPSTTLRQGQRYWYYYVLDGYHASHDPARDSVVEPTTRRSLNILDIPAGPEAPSSVAPTTTRRPVSLSLAIPHGRPLPASSIVSPTPVKPGQQTRQIRAEQFCPGSVDRLAARLASQRFSVASSTGPASPAPDSEEDSDSDDDDDSDCDSDVPSLTSSRSSGSRASSPTSSVTSTGSRCSCLRFGITRAGARVRIDCGGERCGYDDGEGSCCEDEDEDEEEEEERAPVRKYRLPATAGLTQRQRDVRRRGMVWRE